MTLPHDPCIALLVRGTNNAIFCTGRIGHAGPHVGVRDKARPSSRFLEHGVVHVVTWFNYVNDQVQEVWTHCGQYFATSTRTDACQTVTCLGCLGRACR